MASIMMHCHQLIPCGQHSEVQTFEFKKFIISTLLPPCDKTMHVGKQPEVSALLYLFHFAKEVEENFTSVFLPTTLFPMLVGMLTDKTPVEKAWKLVKCLFGSSNIQGRQKQRTLGKAFYMWSRHCTQVDPCGAGNTTWVAVRILQSSIQNR